MIDFSSPSKCQPIVTTITKIILTPQKADLPPQQPKCGKIQIVATNSPSNFNTSPRYRVNDVRNSSQSGSRERNVSRRAIYKIRPGYSSSEMAPVTQNNLVSCRQIKFLSDPAEDKDAQAPSKQPAPINSPGQSLTKNSTNYLLKIPENLTTRDFLRNQTGAQSIVKNMPSQVQPNDNPIIERNFQRNRTDSYSKMAQTTNQSRQANIKPTSTGKSRNQELVYQSPRNRTITSENHYSPGPLYAVNPVYYRHVSPVKKQPQPVHSEYSDHNDRQIRMPSYAQNSLNRYPSASKNGSGNLVKTNLLYASNSKYHK